PSSVYQEAEYTYALPTANFIWRFTDELQLRLGAAKTMARPAVSQLAPTNTTESVSWGEFTQIYGGNAELEPYSAEQADASLEWYFAENSIANFAVFHKRIENQITTSWEPGQDIGVGPIVDTDGNPVTSGPTLFNVMRPINGDYAKVHGFEAGLQHFWENGFGFRAQYTRNWSSSWVADEERPLEGIAPSVYSLGVMYEKGPWSVGATADRTDGFVTAINVLGGGYNEQADPITWLTAHASYSVNDALSISLEGSNLLDEENTYSINGNPLLSQGYYLYGRSMPWGQSYRFWCAWPPTRRPCAEGRIEGDGEPREGEDSAARLRCRDRDPAGLCRCGAGDRRMAGRRPAAGGSGAGGACCRSAHMVAASGAGAHGDGAGEAACAGGRERRHAARSGRCPGACPGGGGAGAAVAGGRAAQGHGRQRLPPPARAGRVRAGAAAVANRGRAADDRHRAVERQRVGPVRARRRRAAGIRLPALQRRVQ